ncbi:MAG: Peptidase [Verrucomicrobiales bacterium]|nr:Peptidase [Verrucomicrobiales bacterium]
MPDVFQPTKRAGYYPNAHGTKPKAFKGFNLPNSIYSLVFQPLPRDCGLKMKKDGPHSVSGTFLACNSEVLSLIPCDAKRVPNARFDRVPKLYMKQSLLFSLLYATLVFSSHLTSANEPSGSLTDARRNFKTVLVARPAPRDPVDRPPIGSFNLINYKAPGGNYPAYVSPNPGDGKKHPAILWIAGGDCNSIGNVWSAAPRNNDQTAAAYRKAGIIMMFPSLRGGNLNPGAKEGFFGEVDDVLAASVYLEKLSYVDTNHIYLGGHSTGGTLALLVSECSDRFRTVFSFGPVDDVTGYGPDSSFLPFKVTDKKETFLRSPGYWLDSIKSPVWVFEGSSGNTECLRTMAKTSKNAQIHFIEVPGATHFTILAPLNELIARKILQDSANTNNISFTKEEVINTFSKR